MAVISGKYNFQSLENDDLILECFERIGLAGDQLVPVQINSARRSLNFPTRSVGITNKSKEINKFLSSPKAKL